MSEHVATIVWSRDGQDFLSNTYSRVHELRFDGGTVVPGSPAPSVVPAPMSDPAGVDPEEAFVAALSSCHMLFFLSLAAKKRFIIDSYVDDAVGFMGKNEEGRTAILRVELRPKIEFSGDRLPTSEDIDRIHHLSHEHCFIANSVNCDVVVV